MKPNKQQGWFARRLSPTGGTEKIRVVVELVYCDTVVHSLSGPTAWASISELADRYNRTGKIPSVKTARTRADGWEQPKKRVPGGEYKDFVLPEDRK